MHWIAPSEKHTDNAALEKRLWDAADQIRANSGLKSQEYSAPVHGLICLRFAEVPLAAQRARLEKASASARRGSRVDEPAANHAEGILYLPTEARFDYLLNRPEAENMNRIPFFSGPEKLHQEFSRLVAPMIRKSQLLQRQVQNLRRTRDLLLPRLLSGQVNFNEN